MTDRRWTVAIGAALLLASCKKPTAMEVCRKLEQAQVASSCARGMPGGIGAMANEKVDFVLPGEGNKKGQVLSFASDDDLKRGVEAFGQAAALAGDHRYQSKGARVLVQLNKEVSAGGGAVVRQIVDGL